MYNKNEKNVKEENVLKEDQKTVNSNKEHMMTKEELNNLKDCELLNEDLKCWKNTKKYK